MIGSHQEKALARIEGLLGQEEDVIVVFLAGRDGNPLPGDPLRVIGGTEKARATALAKWRRRRAARVKKAQAT